MFRTVPLSIISSFSLYTQQWYMSYRFADCLRAGWVPSWSCSQAVSNPVWHIQGVPLATEPGISLIILPLMRILQWSLKRTTDTFLFVSHTTDALLFKFCCNIFIGVTVIKEMPLLCVQWKTPDDGQKNCPKHVEFYSKNKFENLVHLVGFVIRIYHDARSPERQNDVQ